ncbi:hypothetical protein B0H34DRAFT_670044 [Crassisporium funariophilum]|nr:hypothetical protein B0H34DRAFT_670044 [Crassisporium funariophilum]
MPGHTVFFVADKNSFATFESSLVPEFPWDSNKETHRGSAAQSTASGRPLPGQHRAPICGGRSDGRFSRLYFICALAQVAALNDLHNSPPVHPEVNFQTVCLVTPESVDVSSVKLLRKAFNLVIGVEILEQENAQGLKLLGRPDLTTVLTKLHVFRLTQFSKIVFLDADVLPVRPISHLFNLPHEFSAAPDVGWPDIFNSGVLVLSPGEDKFDQLNQLIKTKPSWDGGDQGLLNEWRGGDWNRLSFTYNTTPTAAYTYAPAYERYGSQISAIHFIGPNKPWSSIAYRPPFAAKQPSPEHDVQRAYHYEALVDRWYDVYDRHYRTQTITTQTPFEIKRYVSAWDAPTAETTAPAVDVHSLEDLKRLAIEGINASVPTSDTRPGEGEYKTLPIEGRFDLMRPRKEVPKEEKPKEDPPPKPFYIKIEDVDSFPSDSFNYEETVSTPVPRHAALGSGDYTRWHTLPTPGPEEMPSSPRLRLISLPPTPTPFPRFSGTTPDFYASESDSESLLLGRPVHTHEHQHQHQHQHHEHQAHHEHQHQHRPQQQQQQQQHEQRQHTHQPPHHEQVSQHETKHQPRHEEPRRPSSPPLLSWNPAVEPPPNTTPTVNAFPSDTYFANVWDHTPSRQNDQVHALSLLSPPDSSGFFQPPPNTDIPESLIKQGHYRNVTGDSYLGATPSPDRSKLKRVFPWEEKKRPLPGRVFPDSDAPQPSLFLSPSSQSQTSTTTPSTPETKGFATQPRTMPLSPLYGLPTTLNYANAWDNVPSIQKYASRLVRPPQPLPVLAPAFEDNSHRKGRRKSWVDDRAEVSSRDGDDEDNADDEDEDEPAASSRNKRDDDDSDSEARRRRSRSGSIVSASAIYGPQKIKKKEYRDCGVQTQTTESRSQGIQVDPPVVKVEPKPVKRLSVSGKRHWAPATGSTLVAPAMTRDISSGSASGNGPDSLTVSTAPVLAEALRKSPSVSPTLRSPLRSPREFMVAPNHNPVRPTIAKARTPPLKPSVRTSNASTATLVPAAVAASTAPSLNNKSSPSLIMRQVSNDSSLGSPASSIGPVSPAEGQPVVSPMRKAGRVWDPARGVDLFKRGSEEVLARFLKMGGSWEEESVR